MLEVGPGDAMQWCSEWPCGARAFGDMSAIHPSPSIRSFFLSFLHDYGDEASDHDEALEEVGPHHGPQTALKATREI